MTVTEHTDTGANEKKRRPATFDHLKAKKPVEDVVEILLDDEPTKAVTEAREALLEAEAALHEKAGDSKLKKARDEAKKTLDKAMNEQDGEIVTIRFRSCGRKRYEEILDANPPTDEEQRKAKDAGGEVAWNSETFPIALISASAVEPELTVDQVSELFDEWNNAEAQMLFLAAFRVNTSRRVPDLGNGFGGTPS